MKTDCFGFSKGQCTILTQPDCEVCSFYASKEQSQIDKKRANQILFEKGLEQQIKKTEDGYIMSTKKIKKEV